MDATQHPDEVERLRIALWGDEQMRDDPAARHVRDCDACGGDVEFNRKLRDAMRRLAEASPSEGAVAHALRTARAADEPAEEDWILATHVGGLAGVRSAMTASMTGDVHAVASAARHFVDVLLHARGAGGRFSVSGQVSDADGFPAARLDVALFVDRRRVAATATDAFGEFAFAPSAGTHWGLRLGAGAAASHVEILPGAGAA